MHSLGALSQSRAISPAYGKDIKARIDTHGGGRKRLAELKAKLTFVAVDKDQKSFFFQRYT